MKGRGVRSRPQESPRGSSRWRFRRAAVAAGLAPDISRFLRSIRPRWLIASAQPENGMEVNSRSATNFQTLGIVKMRAATSDRPAAMLEKA